MEGINEVTESALLPYLLLSPSPKQDEGGWQNRPKAVMKYQETPQI
jgi:hypothetical protein